MCMGLAATGVAEPGRAGTGPAADRDADSAAQNPVTVLRFARLVDGSGERLDGNEIAVQAGSIVAIGDGLKERFPGALTIDQGDLTALPGLIDAHVHVTYGLGGPSRGDAWTQLLEQTPPDVRLAAGQTNALAMLRLGITSARDLFALDGVDVRLKALIDHGQAPGPRLFLSGTGIHPLVMPQTNDPQERLDAMIRRANQVADAGAQWLKIFATTGTADDLTGSQVYSPEEIAAATRTAHARGLKVALHAYGPSAVPDAIRAGVDSIEHAVDVNDDTLRAWAASGIPYVPTIDHNRYYADHRAEYGYNEATEKDLRDFTARNVDMLRRAHRAGIPIVFGSDAVMTMFGQNTRELVWFGEAGMKPEEVIRSATVNGAKLLGQDQVLGRLAPGYAADIIGVAGDPLADIATLATRVRWVMKAGKTEPSVR